MVILFHFNLFLKSNWKMKVGWEVVFATNGNSVTKKGGCIIKQHPDLPYGSKQRCDV